MSGSRITNRPRICVDRMVDITYDDTDRDYKPILSRIDTPEAQRHQKSEESVVEIELQSDLRTPEQVNTQRTYPRY